MLGSRALAARECDRCHLVQVATTTPPATKTTAAERRHSPGSDLLQGVLLNLSTAIAELWKALCTTCQKAAKYLEEKGVPVRAFRNLKEEPLSMDEVRGLAAKVGGVEKLFSKRAMKYRAMGLHEREVPEDEMVRLMSEEYTFVTRPVLVRGERATAGFSVKRVDALVG